MRRFRVATVCLAAVLLMALGLGAPVAATPLQGEGVDQSWDPTEWAVPGNVFAGTPYELVPPSDEDVRNDEAVGPNTSDGGGDDRAPLKKAKRKGDYFYHHSSTYGFNHGHVGIYVKKKRIVEAANAEKGVRAIAVRKRSVPVDKTAIIRVKKTSAKVRKNAVKWSSKRVGAEFRSNFLTSNKTYEAPYNCSQLLWAAYNKQGINLDSHGGFIVMPVHILRHSRSVPYKKV